MKNYVDLKDVFDIKEPEYGAHMGGENEINFKLICHTSVGNPDDEHGRFFVAGKTYDANLEFRGISKDSNWEEFRSCWVSFNDGPKEVPTGTAHGFGSRFAIKGNIYHSWDGKPFWNHFSTVFCSVAELRERQINSILDDESQV